MGRKNDKESGSRNRKRDKEKNRPRYTTKYVRMKTEQMSILPHDKC